MQICRSCLQTCLESVSSVSGLSLAFLPQCEHSEHVVDATTCVACSPGLASASLAGVQLQIRAPRLALASLASVQ